MSAVLADVFLSGDWLAAAMRRLPKVIRQEFVGVPSSPCLSLRAEAILSSKDLDVERRLTLQEQEASEEARLAMETQRLRENTLQYLIDYLHDVLG